MFILCVDIFLFCGTVSAQKCRRVRLTRAVLSHNTATWWYSKGLAGVIAGIAALRLLLSIVPDTVYDVDPLSTGFAYAGIGPAASVLLDALIVCVSGIALEFERRRRGLDGWLLLLVALPLIPLCWHAWHDALDLWRGADWFAGATAAAALAHLARSSRCRELALAIVLGAVVATILHRHTDSNGRD